MRITFIFQISIILCNICFSQSSNWLSGQQNSRLELDESDFNIIDSVNFFVNKRLDSCSYVSIQGKYKFKNDTLFIRDLYSEKKHYSYFFLESHNPKRKMTQSFVKVFLEFTYINSLGGEQYGICDFDYQIDSSKLKYDCFDIPPLVLAKTQLQNMRIDDFPVSVDLKNPNSNEVEIIVQMSVSPMEVEISSQMFYLNRMIAVIKQKD